MYSVHEYYVMHVHLSWISMHIIYSCVALFYVASQCIYMYHILLIPLVCVYMYVHVHHVNWFHISVCECMSSTSCMHIVIASRILSSLYRPNPNPQQCHCYNERCPAMGWYG